MSRVTLSNIRKSYGSTQVIYGVDLDIAEGEFVALVGPSGCGKSTLLRMIAGLEHITGGEIEIGGRVVNGLDPKQRNIAMVFQNYALYPHMTVEQNISLNLRLSRMNKDEIKQRVAKAAKLLDIEDYMSRRPSQLSGGQRQRVAMGRAIVRDPAVFLFDEPLSNLDAKLRVQMRAEIKNLHQSVGTTSVYVTHDQIEAMTLADRIVVLNAGRIEQIGTPLELYETPANRFVAGFIGSPPMNMLKATVCEAEAGGLGAQIGNLGTIALPDIYAVSPGMDVEMGIRPEHLILTDDVTGIPLTVNQVEPTGALTFLMLDCAGQEIVASANGMLHLTPGASVRVRAEAAHIHLFSPSDGARIAPQ